MGCAPSQNKKKEIQDTRYAQVNNDKIECPDANKSSEFSEERLNPQSDISPKLNRCPSSKKMNAAAFVTKASIQMASRYVRIRKLGSGAYGEVILCKDKQTGHERAVKVIKKSQHSTCSETAMEEVNVIKRLDHPNIMKVHEFFEDRRNFYIASEVYTGGELFDQIVSRQKFSEGDAAEVIAQVISGVTYLHNHNIVHRDLKPENLLLENKSPDALIKIVDFGLAAFFNSAAALTDKLGTAYYIAPEVLKKDYDEKCDVWAIGVTLYILLCGYPPFGGDTDDEILAKVEEGKFSFPSPEWNRISAEAKDLIRRMLQYDPANRISCADAYLHAWVQQRKSSEAVSKLLPNTFGNLIKFNAKQRLAQATLLFIGTKLATQEEKKEITRIFRHIDQNADGILSRDELIDAYKVLHAMRHGINESEMSEIVLDPEMVEQEVDEILRAIDFDGSGFLEYSEFVTAAMDKRMMCSKERVKQAFDNFDVENTGVLDIQTLRQLFDVSDDQWQLILVEVDQNGDGKVDFDEFYAMMQSVAG